jgi:hypothetical protein
MSRILILAAGAIAVIGAGRVAADDNKSAVAVVVAPADLPSYFSAHAPPSEFPSALLSVEGVEIATWTSAMPLLAPAPQAASMSTLAAYSDLRHLTAVSSGAW